MNLCFQINEMKQHEIYVLDNDPSYAINIPEFFDTKLTSFNWFSFDNMEFRISSALLG